MTERSMIRVRRMARAVPMGAPILDFMSSAEGRRRLTQAAARGIPPVTAVSQSLVELMGAEALKSAVVRQFCGLVTRAVLDEEGFVPIQAGVRIRNDAVFVTGSVYAKRVSSVPKSDDPVLKRMLDALTVDEMNWAADYLRQRIEELQSAPRSADTPEKERGR